MSRYLLVQSQDPFAEMRTAAQFNLVHRLLIAKLEVGLLLVQNGVCAARQGAANDAFDALLQRGVRIDADTFSLQQRDIGAADVSCRRRR